MSRVKVTGPNPYISCSARIGAWAELRKLATRSGLKLREERIGLITKRFTLTGDGPELERFAELALDSEVIGRQFREELENHYA